MARAMGRSVETEHRATLARMTRKAAAVAMAPEMPQGPDGSIVDALRRAAEITLILMLGIMLSAAALHVVRPEASCASCSAERK